MLKLLKLVAAIFIVVAIAGCGKLTVMSQNWKDRPSQKIDQISMVWLSGANDNWDGASANQNRTATSFSGAGIPPIANELDFGKIGDYFKGEGAVILKGQGIVGLVEATDSRREMIKIIQTSAPQKYWLIFEAYQVNSGGSNSHGIAVGVGVTASLKDMQTGKDIWVGKYNLQGMKHPVHGRKFDAPMIKDMLTAALKSISM